MTTKCELIELLRQARLLSNETVKSEEAVAAWRRRTDRALLECGVKEPEAEYDNPGRVAYRNFVNSLFTR